MSVFRRSSVKPTAPAQKGHCHFSPLCWSILFSCVSLLDGQSVLSLQNRDSFQQRLVKIQKLYHNLIIEHQFFDCSSQEVRRNQMKSSWYLQVYCSCYNSLKLYGSSFNPLHEKVFKRNTHFQENSRLSKLHLLFQTRKFELRLKLLTLSALTVDTQLSYP